MAGSKKILLSGITAFVLALCIVFGIVFATASSRANALYNTVDHTHTVENFPQVNVSNGDDLRAALTSEGDKFIVVTADITVESVLLDMDRGVQPFSSIDRIDVKGNKILDLNGKDVYFSDKSNLMKDDGEIVYRSINDVNYDKTLIRVGNGASLTIVDKDDNSGTLQFDSQFANVEEYVRDPMRNVIEVTEGGRLDVHGGHIIAGRTKFCYVRVRDYNKIGGLTPRQTAACYNLGSAVIVNGGTVNVTGGIFEGRGLHSNYDSKLRISACILYNSGKLNIEDGSFYTYGRTGALHINADTAAGAQIKIKGGYFEAYCHTNSSYIVEHKVYMSNVGAAYIEYKRHYNYPRYDVMTLNNGNDTKPLGDDYEQFLVDAENTECVKTSETDGDEAGDAGKGTIKFVPQNKALNDVLLNYERTTEAVSIYQYQELKVRLDYWTSAYFNARNQFYGTDLMIAHSGATTEEEIREYKANNGITAYFVVSKKVGNEYKVYTAFSVVAGMNEQFPLIIDVKEGSTKWDVGEYKIVCEITEKSNGRSYANYCNVLTVNVASGQDMIGFTDVEPATFVSNMGNKGTGSSVTLKFSATSAIELADGLTLDTAVMVRYPGATKYVEVEKSNLSYVIPVDSVGYYSVMEIVQLKKGNNVVVQKSRECHFTGVDVARTASVVANPNGTILLADINGTVKSEFNPGETVFIQVTPNSNNLRVRNVIVTKEHGGNVTVNNSSFVMPDDNVSVSAAFETVHRLSYKETAEGPTDEVVVFNSDGIVLKGATYTKTGYRQTGWKIGNNIYQFGDVFNENANMTALPYFDEIYYSTVNYDFGENGVYQDDINYYYVDEPLYTVLSEVNIPAQYLDGQLIDYYTLSEDYVSEIEGVTYHAGDRINAGQRIIPMCEGITLVAHLNNAVSISNLNISIPAGETATLGLNSFGLAAPNVRFLTDPDPELNQELTEMNFPAHTVTTIRVYVYPNDGYRFADDVEYAFVYFSARSYPMHFASDPLVEKRGAGLNGTSLILDITFYPSCGADYEDHTWSAEPTKTPIWCTGDRKAEYSCEVCGIKWPQYGVPMPEDLTTEEYHSGGLHLVAEVVGDCEHGEYSIAQHYECEHCGKVFSKPYGQDYVERTIDDFRYLHSWTDYIPGTITVYGNEMRVHYCMCMECGEIDESTIGIHEDANGDGACDYCGYVIPCIHRFAYVEDLSTCSHQGSMTATCSVCGDEFVTIYGFADHNLVYVEATESTCSTHGIAAHYACTDCGAVFDADIYVYIRETDVNGLRFINDIDDEECEYALTDALKDILDDEDDGSYKVEDPLNPGLFVYDWAYIIAHSTAYNSNADLKKAVDAHNVVSLVTAYRLDHTVTVNQLTLPLNLNNHGNTELRNAVAVTANADGYTGDLYCTDCETEIEHGHAVAKHTHGYVGSDWASANDNHWHVCNAYLGCEEILNVGAHTYGDWRYVTYADKVGEKYQECTVCGHVHVEDWIPQPTGEGDNKNYKVADCLEDLSSENGKDVRYIFDLASANDASVTFETNNITITFDKAAVKGIAGHDVRFKVVLSTENLAGYNITNAQLAINVSLSGVTFSSGTATISIPLNVQIPEGNEVKVYYVNGNEKTDMNATYSNGVIKFNVPHFSTYVVAYDAPVTPDTPSDPDAPVTPDTPVTPDKPENKGGLSTGALIGIIVGALAVVAAVGVCVYMFVIKPKANKSATSTASDEKADKGDKKE